MVIKNPITLDRAEYRDIPLRRMTENPYDKDLPVFMRTYGRDEFSAMHRHEMMQINYVTRGTAIHIVNHARHRLVKGDIFVIPPYIPHQLLPNGDAGCEITELEFLPEFVFQNHNLSDNIGKYADFLNFLYIEPFLVAEQNVQPCLNLTGPNRACVEALIADCFFEYKNRDDSFLLALRAILLKLLVQLGRFFRQYTEHKNSTGIYERQRAFIEKALAYINENFAKSIPLEETAKIALLSPSYFSYMFKNITGKTYPEYINSLRIQKAMDMLKETSATVLNVCMDTGFESIAHFNRTFKKAVGVTPTQFRGVTRRRSATER
jgi:AraC-like DNA-binding protein